MMTALFKKKRKGFTLVEVIISIAALGLISAVLLRLFVLSSDTNEAAGNAQKAELLASSAVESLSCAETIEAGLESLGLKYEQGIEEYSFEKQGLTAVISIQMPQQDFPGALYEISVSVENENEQLSCITTKKYVQRTAYE